MKVETVIVVKKELIFSLELMEILILIQYQLDAPLPVIGRDFHLDSQEVIGGIQQLPCPAL